MLVKDLTVEDLEDALWRTAQGYLGQEAAVMLLAFHDTWPRRPAFRQHLQVVADEPGEESDGLVWATVGWTAILAGLRRSYDPDDHDDQLCMASGSARGVLAVAASLAGGGPVDLWAALGPLDDTNLRLVQAAVVHSIRGMAAAQSLWPARP